jgi:hypothetical protein
MKVNYNIPSGISLTRPRETKLVVNAAIESHRIRRLKSIDENLKQFWKYVASFRKRKATSVQLDVDGNHLIEPSYVADTFS